MENFKSMEFKPGTHVSILTVESHLCIGLIGWS